MRALAVPRQAQELLARVLAALDQAQALRARVLAVPGYATSAPG